VTKKRNKRFLRVWCEHIWRLIHTGYS